MVTDILGTILEEFGRAIQMPNLKPDANNSCLIKYKDGLLVQIEMDKNLEYIILGVDFGNISPGIYRENLFGAALKANNLPHPRYGVFCYSKQADHFSLNAKLNAKEFTGLKLAEYYEPFLAKAKKWRQAILRGDVPEIEETSARQPSGMFGLR